MFKLSKRWLSARLRADPSHTSTKTRLGHLHVSVLTLATCLVAVIAVSAGKPASAYSNKWVTSWAASPQGPYPSGNAVAEPDLSFTFPTPSANDQTFRLIVHPDGWSRFTRIRFTNVFGAQPVTFDGAFVGLQKSGATLESGTNRPVSFSGANHVTIQPGQSVWSDPVQLPFVGDEDRGDESYLAGRKLAISFHTVGQTGPMTWHAKAMTTNYVSNPGAGSVGQAEDDQALPNSTTSWYFVDALDMQMPYDTQLVVALGDSITDGTSSTINGDDRWPDVMARRLHQRYGRHVVVVNAGIGGNSIILPATYSLTNPSSGGPSAVQRLGRDVLSLSGVSSVIWFEGTNDVSGGAAVPDIEAGMKTVVNQLRASIPGIRIVGATITSEVGAAGFGGTPQAAAERITLNAFIKTSGLYNAVTDFYAVTTDPTTGGLMPQFVPNTSIGGAGDFIHPNRIGYLAMGYSIDLNSLVRLRY
jgi:lysophospholipase L1-like esterase